MMEPVFPFDLNLDQRDTGTITQTLHGRLRTAILDGRLAAGARLPATRRAAAALGIARNTMVAVYDLLIAEGYLLPRSGAVPVVADVVGRQRLNRVRAVTKPASFPRNPLWQTIELPSPEARELPPRCFRLGIPEHRFFPHEVWRRLTARAQRRWSRHGFFYSPSQGLPGLREAIAHHVAFARAVSCRADDVVVTSGAQQAFDLLARLLVEPGRTRVAIEDPGYPPIRAAFAAAGAILAPVAVDHEGLCVERIPDDTRIICVTPSHQSPTGVVLSARRRQALLALAERRQCVVIEDDYDGEFRYGDRPLDALQTLDRDARVFYVGTFSKSLFPSLRKGFVVAPEWARRPLVAIRQCTDAHCDEITQSVLTAFIEEGHLARHVRRMRPIYAERREALLDALEGRLSRWLEPFPSEAGLHLAARIRDPDLQGRIFEAMRRHAPGAQSVAEYAMSGIGAPALTFGYGVIDAGDISASMTRFATALRRAG